MRLRNDLRNTAAVPEIVQAASEMSKRKLNGESAEGRPCGCPAEPPGLSPALNEFRLGGLFCDAAVHCADGVTLRAHRAVLAAASPYFRAAFTSALGGARDPRDTAVDIPGAFLARILDFAYTGACDMSADDVQELLVYADRFQVAGLVRACCRFLLRQLCPANCFGLLEFARDYFCRDLESEGAAYVRRNFERIVRESDELDGLPFEELREVLDDDELNVSDESTAFEVIKSWVDRDPRGRKGRVSELLQCVRLSQMDSAFFDTSVLKWKYVVEYDLAGRLLERRGRERRPRVPAEVLFAIGGWGTSSPTSYVETYDVRADSWRACDHADALPRAYHGVCALGRLVYVVGGFDGSSHFSTVRCFDPSSRAWAERACMYQARCYVSVAAHDGMLYALGGFNGMARLRSAERYCPRRNQWEMIASMNMARSDAGAASFGGKIYIVGGINGEEVLRCGEVYDPCSAQWTFLPALSGPRSGVSLQALGDCLYALGGFDGSRRLDTCEALQPPARRWHPAASLLTERSNFATAVLDGAIFVIGGFDGTATISSVERYDALNDRWRSAAPMTLNRSALSCCVVSGLSDARHYAGPPPEPPPPPPPRPKSPPA